MENKSVGELITEAREKKGISKNQLADLAKISHTEITRIETGEREKLNPKTLRKISKYICCILYTSDAADEENLVLL